MQDSINTTKGKVGIVFADETKVQVNENSKLVIDEFVYDPKNKDAGKLALNMASGTVRYASGAIAHNNPNKVAINTPTATVAVRGTDFTATVDELGESTVILLPSCPRKDMMPDEIERLCKTGRIDVINDAGSVTLDQPFQGTKVTARNVAPTRPAILHLNEDGISNILILSPPQEIKNAIRQREEDKNTAVTALSQNFLQGVDLGSVLAAQNATYLTNALERNFLDQDFLANILTLLNEELAAEFGNLLAPQKNQLLPDYKKETGVVATVDAVSVQLCRTDSGSNTSCVTVPKDQNSTITQTQSDNVAIKNRVNQGGNTYITIKQN
jgi:FecR protein